MALSIYENLYSLSSQRHLGMNQTALGKSIERLSSGLRINHASDDASGLAISEKMRGQISGLKRAKMNAQDGISYLQTAEGAMEQTSSILQRMRELAVQASNGIYTTNDRAELQKEIDQLKDEIDRISTSTEFNTRKLINGDGTALWSSDSNLLSAVVRSPVAEGNYEITMDVRPGQNQVLKSNIMTLKEGAIGAEITGANNTNVSTVSNPNSLSPTNGNNLTFSISAAGTTTASGNVTGVYAANGSSWTFGNVAVTSTDIGQSGYFEIEMLSDSTAVSSGATFRVRFINAKDGSVGAWSTTQTNVTTTLNVTVGNTTASINMTVGGQIQKGDKMLVAISGPASTNNNLAVSGGGTIQITDGNGVAGPVLVYEAPGSLTPLDNGDNILDVNAVTVYYAEMDTKTGNINLGNITLNFKETAPDTVGGLNGKTAIGSFEVAIQGAGEAATTTTKLNDLAQFIDPDGNNLFDNKQELTIYGNGGKVVVHIEGNDTIATLVEKLNKAIVGKLGMGSDDAQTNANLVRYVSVPDATGAGTIKGTFIIQTALTGKQGELSFIGDQNLINGLGLATIQESSNNESVVTVHDAHTGQLIGTETTGDDRIYTLIEGIDVVMDSRAGVKGTWDPITNTIKFESDAFLAAKKFHLHLVDNRTSLQIGANKGQDLDVSIPQLDVIGLGIKNTVVVSQELARDAITEFDRALAQVVSARATVGAQVSRLEYTINNLATAAENLTSAESRIRDLDVAEESATFARNQILVQSGVAMLAQANQLPQIALTLIKGG